MVHSLCLHPALQVTLLQKSGRNLGPGSLLQPRLHRSSDGAKIWCHSLISLFPFQKKELQLILLFLQAEGRGTFMCVRGWHTPSHLRTALPRNTCLRQLKSVQTKSPDQELLFRGPAILQYLFPTCLVPVIAWECSSQGWMCLGPDMAKPSGANAHPEPGT